MRTQQNSIHQFLGARVDAARLSAGLSKAALARGARMADTTLKRSLTGTRGFTLTELAGVAHALNISVSRFMPDLAQVEVWAHADSIQRLQDAQDYFDREYARENCSPATPCMGCDTDKALTR